MNYLMERVGKAYKTETGFACFPAEGIGKALSDMERDLLRFLSAYGRKIAVFSNTASDFLDDFVQESFLAAWPEMKKAVSAGLEYGIDFTIFTFIDSIRQASRKVRETGCVRGSSLSPEQWGKNEGIESPYNPEKQMLEKERKASALRAELARLYRKFGRLPQSRELDNGQESIARRIRGEKIWIKEQLKSQLINELLAELAD